MSDDLKIKGNFKEETAVGLKESKEMPRAVSGRKVGYGSVDIGPRAWAFLKDCLETSRVSTGPYVPRFEKLFAEVVSAKYAVAVSSGTDACTLMMSSLYDFGAKRGDEVILPALTFSATANSVLAAGLSPKFVDVERETFNIDAGKIEEAITKNTRAIFPVHIMGKPAAMDEIREIAKKHDLLVFEDGCQAHGSFYKGTRIGSRGIGTSFSLYAAHLICTGEGGVVTTDDEKMRDIYMSLRSHGRPPGKLDFDFHRVGFNSKMNELEAALGVDQCLRYEEIRKKRKYNYDYLLENLATLQRERGFIDLPKVEDYEVIGPQGFPFVVEERAPFRGPEIEKMLTEAGIEWKRLFGSLPTQHKAYEFLGYKRGDFPVAEYIGGAGYHIGVHQGLLESDLAYVVSVFDDFLSLFDE